MPTGEMFRIFAGIQKGTICTKQCIACGTQMTKRNGIRGGYTNAKLRLSFSSTEGAVGWCFMEHVPGGGESRWRVVAACGISCSTIRRRFRRWEEDGTYQAPRRQICPHRCHLMGGRQLGNHVGDRRHHGAVQYFESIRHETEGDCRAAIASIENRGCCIKGIIVDGMRSLFSEFARCPMQTCHFHMVSLVRTVTPSDEAQGGQRIETSGFHNPRTDGGTFAM